MANRYWVGGTGDFSDTGHWSTSSGGSSGASVPTSSDIAYLDGNSGTGTVTVDGSYSVAEFICTGYTGTLTFSTSSILSVGTNLNISSGMTLTVPSTTGFASTAFSSLDVTSNGRDLGSLVVSGNSTATILDNFTATTNGLYLLSGSSTFDANGNDVTINTLLCSGTLQLGSGTFTITGDDSQAYYGSYTCQIESSSSINEGTSLLKFNTPSTSNTITLSWGAPSGNFYDFWISGSSTGNFNIILSSLLRVEDFKIDSPPQNVRITSSQTIQATTFTVSGSAGNLIGFDTISGTGQWTLSIAHGTISGYWMDLAHSGTSTTDATFDAYNSTDSGGNSGWNIHPPSSGGFFRHGHSGVFN